MKNKKYWTILYTIDNYEERVLICKEGKLPENRATNVLYDEYRTNAENNGEWPQIDGCFVYYKDEAGNRYNSYK
jgi:hypothetical protein